MATTRSMGSVDKAVLALQRLSEVGPDGRPLNRLAVDLGINKASLHHTLSVLRQRGFVDQNSNGNYRLGNAALSLADSYLHDDSVRQMHGALKHLSRTVNEICHMGILIAEEVVCIEKIVPKSSINTWSTVGFRDPALTTALGRAIVSQTYLDFESFSQAFPTPIFRRTYHTLSTPKEIWLEMVATHKRGFAREIDEFVVGQSCLSVALLRQHKPVAAISIACPTERLGAQREQSLLRSLHEDLAPLLPPGLSLQMPVERKPARMPPAHKVVSFVSAFACR
ncbi:MAG TPA: IclR family transcriptional regulator C-terminal domain-containing protein [Rhizomicrobium sp.]|jgi:DNA-binding IclR family transcriptional regulator|nr:IclR family transcriptional regulator C-terminal domain-containing protein [Rhizomicrobium sp.]